MKKCSKCKKVKGFVEFHKNKTTIDGFQSHCKICMKAAMKNWRVKNPEKMKLIYKKRRTYQSEYCKEYKRKNPEKFRLATIKYKYGLEPIEYYKIRDEQSNLCAICKSPPSTKDHRTGNIKELSIDHDHKTGQVRGLLCHSCNVAIGSLRDSLDIIKATYNYVKRFK